MNSKNEPTNESIVDLIKLFSEGKNIELKKNSQRIIDDFPDSGKGFLFHGISYYMEKNYKQSEEFLEKATRLDEKEALAFNFLGLVKKNLSKNDEAIMNYKKSFDLNPKDGSPLSNLSNLYRELGKFEESLKSANLAVKASPNNINFKINKISALINLRKIDEAKILGDKCLSEDESNPVILNNLGVINNILNDFITAKEQFAKALQLNPQYIDANKNYIETLIGLNDLDGALNGYKELILKYPNDTSLFTLPTNLFIKIKKEIEGIKFFNNLIPKLGDRAPIYNQIGILFRLINNNSDALINFNKAINLEPNNAAFYSNVGAAYYEEDDYVLAEENYLKALDLNPNEYTTYHNLGNLKNAQKDFESANKYYSLCLEKNNSFYDSFHSLIKNKSISENDERVQFYLDRLENGYLDDQSVSTLAFAFGNFYEQLAEYEEAFKYYKMANDNYKKTEIFDYTMTKELFEGIKKLSKQNNQNKLTYNKEDFLPIFIIGLPRSGSTLIEQIISNHSLVEGLGEISYFSKIIHQNTIYNKTKIPINLSSLSIEENSRIKTDYLNRVNRLLDKKKIFTDKNLSNFLNVNNIFNIFPNAKIIHVKRDILDQCFSMYSVRFTGSHSYAYDLEDLGKYYRLYEDLMNYWNHLYPHMIYEVSYENVVNNQEYETKKMLEYCGLNFEQNCLSFYENKRPVKTASVYQVRQKMYSSSIKRSDNFLKELDPLISALKEYEVNN